MASFRFQPRLVEVIKRYGRDDLRADVLSGVTVGIVALPLAMAFAIASGVPPQAGLFTAIIAGFLISALGGTKLAIGGPTGAYVVIVAGIVHDFGVGNLIVCTMMAGLMLIAMGLMRMGQIIKYFPMPLITGFTNGIAVLIFLTQLKDFLGLDMQSVPSGFFAGMKAMYEYSGTIHLPTVALGTACVALIFVWPKWLNRFVPAPFLVLLLSSVLVYFLELPLATIGSRFGDMPSALPDWSLPAFDMENFSKLMGPAFTIAMLGAIESLLCAVVADNLTNDKHDSNQELVAQGIANLVTPLFGGIPATGAIARTATNIANGGRTPVSGIVHALFLLLVLVLAAPLASHIPLVALAGILISVALKMGDWDIRKAWRYPIRDTAVLALTFALTVVFDLTVAVEIGLLIAAMFFIEKMASQTVINQLTPEHARLFERHSISGKNIPDGVLAFRAEGALFFGAVDKLDILLQSSLPQARVVILQLHRVVLVDTTGLLALQTLGQKMSERGQVLMLASANEATDQLLREAGLYTLLGEANIQPDLETALQRASSLLSA